jgi:hypothetical protein
MKEWFTHTAGYCIGKDAETQKQDKSTPSMH